MDLAKWIGHCEDLSEEINCVEDGENKYLLSNFQGTSQQKDIEKRTALIGDFFRVKINSKAFDKEVDFKKNGEVFDALRNEFDMPYWAFHALKNAKLQDYNNVFISQIKGCNIFCPWCFVDDVNKNFKMDNGSAFFSMREIVDALEKEREKQELNQVRTSGGEPTLAVMQWKDMLEELEKRGLSQEVYFQGETNLTTGHYLDRLEYKGKIEKNFLDKIGEHKNFGVLSSFKGTDTESFLNAIGMNKKFAFLEKERWYSFAKMVDAGIDAYPFVYDPDPETIESFMEKGAKKFGEGFYLKTWVFPLKLYGPEEDRMKAKGLDPVSEQKRLDQNFARTKEKMQEIVYDKFGVNYQAILRPGIELKVRK